MPVGKWGKMENKCKLMEIKRKHLRVKLTSLSDKAHEVLNDSLNKSGLVNRLLEKEYDRLKGLER